MIALSRNRWTALIHAVIAAAGSAAVIETIHAQPQIARGTGTAGAVTVLLVAARGGACSAPLTAIGTRVLRVRSLAAAPARSRWAWRASVAVAVIAGAAIAGPHLVSKAWNEFRHPQVVQSANPAARLTSLSGYRYQLWKVALDAFDRHPLRGTGAGHVRVLVEPARHRDRVRPERAFAVV